MKSKINPSDTISLYVHWPYCIKKCPYCDFNSHILTSLNNDEWKYAFLEDLKYESRKNPSAKLKSIFFGGGTPSTMDANITESIIKMAKSIWFYDEKLEISLEANPTTVETDKFLAFRDAGVNRISIGIQSLNDDLLKFLGRNHSSIESKRAAKIASKIFDNISFDLIYALPDQDSKSWIKDLKKTTDLLQEVGGRHISCYQLTIEDKTKFKILYEMGHFKLPNEDESASLFDITQNILDSINLPSYEISNHATKEDQCIHNVHIWNGGLYAGIGPGAHGVIMQDNNFVATTRIKSPRLWLNKIKKKDKTYRSEKILMPEERAKDLLILGLRLSSGFNLNMIELQTGIDKFSAINKDQLTILKNEDFLSQDQDCIKATPKGKLVLNKIIHQLVN